MKGALVMGGSSEGCSSEGCCLFIYGMFIG